jgi:hypothetical protein
MVVGVGFCKIKVDSNFLLVLKIKCTKFHQDRSKTVDLHTKYTNKQTFSFIYIDKHNILKSVAPNILTYKYQVNNEDLQHLYAAFLSCNYKKDLDEGKCVSYKDLCNRYF